MKFFETTVKPVIKHSRSGMVGLCLTMGYAQYKTCYEKLFSSLTMNRITLLSSLNVLKAVSSGLRGMREKNLPEISLEK